jgi:hypothetical protein
MNEIEKGMLVDTMIEQSAYIGATDKYSFYINPEDGELHVLVRGSNEFYSIELDELGGELTK